MSSALPGHPESDRLAAFGLGLLEEAESADIERHLDSCDTCCSALAVTPDDGLISRLRASFDPAGIERGEPPAELANHPRYHVLEFVGAGGMGAVYKAEHRLMERPVALKVIRRRLMDRPAAVERFQREVKAAARLAHPNIVQAYDAEQVGNTHFLAMEWVEGKTLAELVGADGALPCAEACDYVRQAALGLQHAYEQGMVHRDIKPQNLMLTKDGRIKILDFGLARFIREMGEGEEITEFGTVMGTADYIAPEQAREPRQADIRADIYSLGCTLYFLIAGRPPFPRGSSFEKVTAHLERMPQPLRELQDAVSPELSRLIERMMAKDPATRYQSPAEVAEALTGFVSGSPPPRRVVSPTRRFAWITVAAALLMIVTFVVYEITVRIRGKDGKETVFQVPEGSTVQLEQDGKVVAVAPLAHTTSRELRRFEGHTDIVWRAVFSPDGRRILTGSTDKSLRLWDTQTGKELNRFSGEIPPVNDVAFSPDGQYALSCGEQGSISLWNIETGEERRRFKGHAGNVWSVAFSRDGRLALSGGQDRAVRLWNVETGKEVRRFTGHQGTCRIVRFLPDGRRAISASHDHTIRLWEVETGQEVRRLTGHRHWVSDVAVTADGRRVLSGSYDWTLRLWDLESGKQVQRIQDRPGVVNSVALSADGRHALSAGRDGDIRVWDVESGRLLHSFKGHSGAIVSLAFSADRRYVLSAGSDGIVRLWAMPQLGKAKP